MAKKASGNFRVGTAPKKSIVGKMMRSKIKPLKKLGNKVADRPGGYKRTVNPKQAAKLVERGRKVIPSGPKGSPKGGWAGSPKAKGAGKKK